MRRAIATAFVLLAITVHAEPSFLGGAKLGMRMEDLSDLRLHSQIGSDTVYTRTSDAKTREQLGVSELLYIESSGFLQAVEIVTATKVATINFSRMLLRSWGKPTGGDKDRQSIVWKTDEAMLTMTIAPDGTARIRIETVVLTESRPSHKVSDTTLYLEALGDEYDAAQAEKRRHEEAVELARITEQKKVEAEQRQARAIGREVARAQCGGTPGSSAFVFDQRIQACRKRSGVAIVPAMCCSG